MMVKSKPWFISSVDQIFHILSINIEHRTVIFWYFGLIWFLFSVHDTESTPVTFHWGPPFLHCRLQDCLGQSNKKSEKTRFYGQLSPCSYSTILKKRIREGQIKPSHWVLIFHWGPPYCIISCHVCICNVLLVSVMYCLWQPHLIWGQKYSASMLVTCCDSASIYEYKNEYAN